jgi:CheY-like chemotaxis protein
VGERIVLCVDDELLILLAMKHALRKELGPAFRIETADGGESALDLMRELEARGGELAAVVSDWLMPGMRGDEFLRKVRLLRPDLRLILLTGYADRASVASLQAEIGLAAILQKPCGTDELAKIIRE